jgi:hypothetical protein
MAPTSKARIEPTFKPVANVPKSIASRSRESVPMKAWRAAQKSDKAVVAQGLDAAGAERFYRSMLQWKRRHPEKRVAVRKVGDEVYVWIADPPEDWQEEESGDRA